MNKDYAKTIAKLVDWLHTVVDKADKDEKFSVSWFEDTKHDKFNIVAGWSDGFSKDYADLLYISKEEPQYAMCVKVVQNEEPYAYVDFDLLNMPVEESGAVDDTCFALERMDDLEAVAQFLYGEWERITMEYME